MSNVTWVTQFKIHLVQIDLKMAIFVKVSHLDGIENKASIFLKQKGQASWVHRWQTDLSEQRGQKKKAFPHPSSAERKMFMVLFGWKHTTQSKGCMKAGQKRRKILHSLVQGRGQKISILKFVDTKIRCTGSFCSQEDKLMSHRGKTESHQTDVERLPFIFVLNIERGGHVCK